MTTAAQLAITKFKEQTQKAGLSLSRIREANLTVTKSPTPRQRPGYAHFHTGYDVSFMVSAVCDQGKRYECETSVFVAPHDPTVEQRSRAPQG